MNGLTVTDEESKTLCLIGQQERCCRYLTPDRKGFQCAKHTGLGVLLDDRVAKGTITARGDNCEGKLPEPEVADGRS